MADEIQSIDFSIKTDGAKSAKTTLVDLVKSVTNALNGTSAEADKLSAKFDKATAAVEKQRLKVAELQKQLDGLKSGDVLPTSMSKLAASFENIRKKVDMLKGKYQELQWQIEQTESGKTTKFGSIDTLKSKLQDTKKKLQELEQQATNTGNALDTMFEKDVPQAIDKTNTQLDYEKAKLKELENTAKETGKKMGESTNPFKQALEKAGTTVTTFGQRILGLVKRVFVFTVITKGLRAVRDNIGAVMMTDSAFVSSLNQLQAALWTAFAPIVQIVVPWLQIFIQWVTNAMVAVGQFIAMLTGKSYSAMQKEGKLLKDRVDRYKESAKAATGAGNAGKKAADKETKALEKQLAAFDELQTLQTNKDTSTDTGSAGAGGGGGTAIPALGEWETPDFTATKKQLDLIKDIVLAIGFAFAAWKISGLLSDTGTLLGRLGKFAGVLGGIAGAYIFVKNMADAWVNGIDWKNFAGMLGGAVGAVAALYKGVSPLAGVVASLAAGIALVVTGIKDTITNGATLKNGLTIMAGVALPLLTILLKMGKLNLDTAFGALITAAGAAATIQGVIDALANGVDWSNFLQIMIGLAGVVAGLTTSFGKMGTAAGLGIAAITLALTGIMDFVNNGPSIINVFMMVGAGIAAAFAVATAGGSLLVSILVGVVVGVGSLVVAIATQKEAVMSVKDAQEQLTKAIDDTKNATDEYVSAVDDAEAAERRLAEAEKNAGMTGEELFKQVENGTLDYKDMNEQQKELYKAYINNEKKQKTLKESTEKLTKAKEAEKKASWDNEMAIAKESGQYDKLKESVVAAFEKGELSAEEARVILSKSMTDMSDSARKAFAEDIPKDIADGLDPEKYETVAQKFSRWGASLWDGFKKSMKNVTDALGITSSGSSSSKKKSSAKTQSAMSKVAVPALARGSVVRPNREFLALLGDNKTETEIVSPLSTIEKALENVLTRRGGSDSGLKLLMNTILEMLDSIQTTIVEMTLWLQDTIVDTVKELQNTPQSLDNALSEAIKELQTTISELAKTIDILKKSAMQSLKTTPMDLLMTATMFKPIFKNLKPVLQDAGKTVKSLWANAFEPVISQATDSLGYLQETIEKLPNTIIKITQATENAIEPIMSWIAMYAIPVLFNLKTQLGAVSKSIESILATTATGFDNLKDKLVNISIFANGVFIRNWTSAMDKLVLVTTSRVQTVIKSFEMLTVRINNTLAAINRVRTNLNFATSTRTSLPALARGTVVPPNKEFAAVLGDNKTEPEIVSPLSTMEQAVENVLSRMGYSNNSAPTEVVLKVNDREFGRAVVDLGGQAKRVRGNTFVKTKLIYG